MKFYNLKYKRPEIGDIVVIKKPVPLHNYPIGLNEIYEMARVQYSEKGENLICFWNLTDDYYTYEEEEIIGWMPASVLDEIEVETPKYRLEYELKSGETKTLWCGNLAEAEKTAKHLKEELGDKIITLNIVTYESIIGDGPINRKEVTL